MFELDKKREIDNLVILTDSSTDSFNDKCKKLIDGGYEPITILDTLTEKGVVYFFQQFVLYIDKEKTKSII